MRIFPLTFSEVTIVLGSSHLISPTRISALQSRIKDFQRHEFPPGLNTGKGKAAAYGPAQIILLSLAFQFLELGMAPNRIRSVLNVGSDAILYEVKRFFGMDRKWFDKVRTLIYFDPAALESLRTNDEVAYAFDGLSIGTKDDLHRLFVKGPRGAARIAVVDLIFVLDDIISIVCDIRGAEKHDVIGELVDWSSE